MWLFESLEGRLLIALAIGLLIGAERERRKGTGADRKPAGLRTFALVALAGGASAALGHELAIAAGLLAIGGLATASYLAGDRSDPGLTSEVALVLTYALGALAQTAPRAAVACGVVAASLLALRAPLHRFTRLLTEDELRDALVFGICAAVVLPLLPDRTVDPWGVLNPFTLWRLVVVLMTMSAAGYIAQRALGPRYGMAIAGVAGGFVSSSATIAAMGGRARSSPELLRAAGAAGAASSVATFVQLAILVAAADPALLARLAWPLGAGGGLAAAWAAILAWGARDDDASPARGRAFKLSSAILFAVLVTVVAGVSTLARDWLGAAGAMATPAIAGLADAHSSSAAAAAMSAAGHLERTAAAYAVLLAVTANSATKIVLAFTSGPRRYALVISGGLVVCLAGVWTAAALVL